MQDKDTREFLPLMLMLYPKGQQSFNFLWEEFIDTFHLEEVRIHIAEALEVCLCSDHSNFSNPTARSNAAFFFSQLMALLEAKFYE